MNGCSRPHLSRHLSCPQASCILQLVKYIQKLQQKDIEVAEEVSALFAGELNPVAPKAQKKVPVPEGWVCSLKRQDCLAWLDCEHTALGHAIEVSLG